MANMQEHHFSQAISKNLNFEVDPPPQRGQELKYIDFQLQDQHSSSTESTSLSRKEFTAMGKASSQDQCASSDSVHDESYGKHGQEMKGGLFLGNPELSINTPHAEMTQPIVQFPYAYTDPYFTGMFTPYGPHNIMMADAAASGRVPLPGEIPEDGPIYVNAKQYHGILRRRQTRAKLEAQNKLVKTRKPYLHESRHQHALNRVRGTGGRFLSTKKQQAEGSGGAEAFHFGYGEGGDGAGGDAMLQQSDGRFSNMAYNGNRRYASIVR
ncbi:nuclear transcription factor Y subunit A-3-like isoform X1 [Salvia hispanica]|uniref:nuclear transcription factor Y subunit A-3-like isoform X1 n=2 Tax=Salvia hispanica TaxID=49212 RepID=UPI00200926EA|nr:nuclear transcription factor Y subunit A-3-like isoform X1 [Salvia hispanica]XP_047947019.1 nuclear transcription factor Y subunit A-3-like isoform X1 [Salvia hispanica]